jgi:hypothetical protein
VKVGILESFVDVLMGGTNGIVDVVVGCLNNIVKITGWWII